MLTEEDKKKALEYEEFYAQINALRNPSSGGKKWWEAPVFGSLMTAVLTAIITIGGGYFAQSLMKSNDFEQDLFKSELAKKREFLDSTNNLIADIMTANEEGILFAQGKYDEFPTEEQIARRNEANKASDQWNKKRESAEFQVSLYYGNRPDIVKSWKDTRKVIDEYCDCTAKIYEKFQEPSFMITEQSLMKLRAEENVPDEVITKLQKIKNQKVTEQDGYISLLKKAALGEKQIAEFEPVILKHSVQGAPPDACKDNDTQARLSQETLRKLMADEYREQVFQQK